MPFQIPASLKSRKLWAGIAAVATTLGAWASNSITGLQAVIAIVTTVSVYMGAQGAVDAQSAKAALPPTNQVTNVNNPPSN